MEAPWTPDSWQQRPLAATQASYEDADALARAVRKLRSLPPLVTSWEVERLRGFLAEAQQGRRFVLQGGDCAESLDECRPDVITAKLKILLQMSLVLVESTRRPVVRIGRMAGQYAKPRSKPTEMQDGVELPSYFGDLFNSADFTRDARRGDPDRMVTGYQHAAVTLNFVRSLSEHGFADLHHPEYWDLRFFEHADLSPELRAQYRKIVGRVSSALRFMEALSENPVEELSRVEFFTSHEGLNLHYEEAQTRTVPRHTGHYDLTTHMPWIGERTRDLKGAHVEFFRGIRNPVGVKLGPTADADTVLELIDVLNPHDEPGKLVLIVRMGAQHVADKLPPLIEAVRRRGRRVLWMSDPMHGNTSTTESGIKTRRFDDILAEVEQSVEVHAANGSRLGGVHFELTGEDVTECIGAGTSEADLDLRYVSKCDPRLNYRQALEMAFRIAGRML